MSFSRPLRFFTSLLGWCLLLLPGRAHAQAAPDSAVTYRFVVTQVPANTPHDAALYVVGSFNNWQPADARYRLRRQPDGTWQAVVRSLAPTLDYKVSRGSWASVEGNAHGDVLANRHATRAEARAGSIRLRIRSWEDLTGTFQFYSLYDLLLLFSCLQGLLLLVALPSIQQANRAANRWLLALLGAGAAATLLKVVSGYREVANLYPTLQLVPDFLWLSYGPLFYLYLRRLLFRDPLPARRRALHFLPAGVQLLVYLPYFLLDGYEFQLQLVNHDPGLRGVLLGVGALGFGSSLGYWLACRQLVQGYLSAYQASGSAEQEIHHLRPVLGVLAVCLGLWAFLLGAVLASRVLAFDVYTLADRVADLIWLVLSAIPYVLGYVAIHQPEIFKLPALQAAPAAHAPVVSEAAETTTAPRVAAAADDAARAQAASVADDTAGAPVAGVAAAPLAAGRDEAPAGLPAAEVATVPAGPTPVAPAEATVLGAGETPAAPELAPLPPTAAPEPALLPSVGPPAVSAPLAPELLALRDKLGRYMQQHRPHLHPNLTLPELAAAVQVPPHVLSRVINEGFGQSFFDFVNGYRVAAFQQRRQQPDARQFTLLALAFEVGFNSKTAFNRAFKKHTGLTPREQE